MNSAAAFLLLALVILYRFACFAGCAYLVFFKGASGWWFLMATLAAMAVSFNARVTR